jgi:type I restriction enzyme, R subunit
VTQWVSASLLAKGLALRLWDSWAPSDRGMPGLRASVRKRLSLRSGGRLALQKINEDEAELLIEAHLRERGWDVTDFTVTRKRWREHLDGEEADRVFLHDGKIVAILEAKKPGRDLWAALEQIKGYTRTYKRNTGHEIVLIFASDGKAFLGEILRPQALQLQGTLRDYQRVAVSQVLAAGQEGRRRMYLQMATGTGKTITAAGVIAKLWAVGIIRRSLFLVDRDALAVQTVRKFKNHLGDNFSIECATGSKQDKHRDILVTTIQHLAVRNKYQNYDADHFGLVILDECHRSYFGDWHGVLEHFATGGAILLGLTATPADNGNGQYGSLLHRFRSISRTNLSVHHSSGRDESRSSGVGAFGNAYP